MSSLSVPTYILRESPELSTLCASGEENKASALYLDPFHLHKEMAPAGDIGALRVAYVPKIANYQADRGPTGPLLSRECLNAASLSPRQHGPIGRAPYLYKSLTHTNSTGVLGLLAIKS